MSLNSEKEKHIRFYSDCFEQTRMSQRQFDHLFDLSQLFATAPDIVIADLCQTLLLFGTLDWFALRMDHGVRRNDTVRCRIGFDDFKFDGSHATAHQKEIAFVHRPIRFGEVRFEVDVK